MIVCYRQINVALHTFDLKRVINVKVTISIFKLLGCRIEIEATTTIVQSPSYLAGPYGANMDCSWVITNADQTGASITFPDEYEYDIDDDRLKVWLCDLFYWW